MWQLEIKNARIFTKKCTYIYFLVLAPRAWPIISSSNSTFSPCKCKVEVEVEVVGQDLPGVCYIPIKEDQVLSIWLL